MTVQSGRLIAMEGIDGCGKTTQARILADALGALMTHEPGATPLGRALRRILLGDESSELAGRAVPVARAEALLMAADRAQHVTEVLRPALARGRWVVTDRFSGSTLAYQGYGQGLPLPALARLVDWAADAVVPDLSVLVDVPLDVARERLTQSPDRLERMDDRFFARVRAGYLQLAEQEGDHWVVVDGTAPVAQVAAAVAAAVLERVGVPPAAVAGPAAGPRP